jgi:hypothetical protein
MIKLQANCITNYRKVVRHIRLNGIFSSENPVHLNPIRKFKSLNAKAQRKTQSSPSFFISLPVAEYSKAQKEFF